MYSSKIYSYNIISYGTILNVLFPNKCLRHSLNTDEMFFIIALTFNVK